MMKCNCGREARYSHFVGDEEVYSCNKYTVCKTYDELLQENKALRGDLLSCISNAQDLLLFREGTDYYKQSEAIVLNLKEKYNVK